MNSITIFTIAYNDYGKFLPNWIENIQNQTIKPSVIIVLGKKHNADEDLLKKMLKDYNFKIIHSDSEVMGTLRNLAVREVKTDWMLYFSADDKLLPNAVENIVNEKCDVVALKFINRDANGREIKKKSGIFHREELKNWKKSTTIPGYIAVKGKYYYEDIEIPNYPYMFLLASKGLYQKHSEEICAVYLRRTTSHGYKASRDGKYMQYVKEIDKYADKYSKKGGI